MKIYFAGSIRGGREKQEAYIKIVENLKKYGVVLDEHVASPVVDSLEKDLTLNDIYERDVNWISEADIMVAEVSKASLGVGYELAYAEKRNIPVICVCEEDVRISAMIGGNKNFKIIKYKNIEELLPKLESEIKSL